LDTATIEIDHRTGRVTGGSARERLGLAALRAAATALARVEDLGLSKVAGAVAAAFPSKAVVRLRLAPDTVFEFPYGDPYWSTLMKPRRQYEPEVEAFLTSVAALDYLYLDCGANYGYWSVLVSSRAFGGKRAVAVEASGATFRWLARNAAANGGRFAVRHNAISDVSGESVRISGGKHEARSIVGAAEGEPVTTVSVDDLAAEAGAAPGQPIVLKLDVEGVEIRALSGAARVLAADTLVVYEEHGSDREHAVSRHLEGLGMRLFRPTRQGVRPLTSLAELDRLKTNPRWGYDLFATRSPVWLAALAAAARPASP